MENSIIRYYKICRKNELNHEDSIQAILNRFPIMLNDIAIGQILLNERKF